MVQEIVTNGANGGVEKHAPYTFSYNIENDIDLHFYIMSY